MIDDLQDEYVDYSSKKGSDKKHLNNSFGIFLIIFAVWLVFATVYVIVSVPKIKTALEVTNAVEIIKNIDNYKQKGDDVSVKAYFVNPAGSEPVLVESEFEVESTGVSDFHDAVEGLLKGPSNEALLQGSISFIDSQTRLLGITESNGVVFVDLSEEFLGSASDWGSDGLDVAKDQVVNTIKAVDSSINKVIILVEGTQI